MITKIALALLCVAMCITYANIASKATTKPSRIINWLCAALWFASAVCQGLVAFGF